MKKINLLILCLFVLFLVSCASSPVQQAAKETVPQNADLSGTWKLSVTSPGGTGNPVFTLKKDGDKFSGTYQGRWGDAPCTATVKGNDFEITYTLGGTIVVYKGKVDGTKMIGNVDFGGQGTGDFTGEKAK